MGDLAVGDLAVGDLDVGDLEVGVDPISLSGACIIDADGGSMPPDAK